MSLRLLFSFALSLALGLPLAADPLVVFAAASLKEPMDKIALELGDTVVSYGGSGQLARQVLLGAPADVVVLAHPDWMDVLAQNKAIKPASRVDVLGNTLVVIGHEQMPFDLLAPSFDRALGRDGRLAMGLTSAVPAGQYGKAALQSLDLWDHLSDRLAEVDSVRGALALVARKEAPLGIVYATDALIVPTVHVLATFPADSHPSIIYPAARISDDPRAAAFLAHLMSASGQEIFARAGFIPLVQN